MVAAGLFGRWWLGFSETQMSCLSRVMEAFLESIGHFVFVIFGGFLCQVEDECLLFGLLILRRARGTPILKRDDKKTEIAANSTTGGF